MASHLLELILRDTVTMQSVLARIHLLKSYLANKLFADGKLPAASEERELRWLEALPIDSLGAITKDTIGQTFDGVEEEVKNLRPLVIFVPLSLPHDEIDALGKRLRTTYGQQFLIDVRIDPLLIGGAALAVGGVYKDYSLRQRISQQRETIIASFQKYIR